MRDPNQADKIAAFARREYYFVKAARPMSDGNPPHGRCKGFIWDHGYTGPHTHKEARRIAAIWGGEIITMAEGLKALADMEAETEPDTVETDEAAAVDDELVRAAVEEVEGRSGYPPYEETDYFTVVQIMKDAGFDYEMAGGGRKKANVIKAWDIFRSGNTA